MRHITEVWLKALTWAEVTGFCGSRLSSSTARQARPCGLQPANCIEKLAAVEVTVTNTASSSRRLVCTLAPAAPRISIRPCGLVASKPAPEAAAGLAAGGLAGAATAGLAGVGFAGAAALAGAALAGG